MMWRDESGILEMLFTYIRKFEKSEDWKSYREILIEILDCHEQFKRQCEEDEEDLPIDEPPMDTEESLQEMKAQMQANASTSNDSSMALGDDTPLVKEEPAFFDEEDITRELIAPTGLLIPTTGLMLPTTNEVVTSPSHIVLRAEPPQEENEEQPGDRPYGCPYCPKRFKQRSSVTRHAAVHLTVTYNCGLCHRVFSNEDERNAHQDAHMERRKFCCSFCPLTFNHKCAREAHERRHTRLKPYKCSFCNKAFSQRGNQKRHELIHTLEKPFACRHCGRRFNQPSSRRAHEKIHEKQAREKEISEPGLTWFPAVSEVPPAEGSSEAIPEGSSEAPTSD